MTAMVTPKNPLLHFQLVIVKELLKEARFGVFVELRAHQASRAVPRAHLARGINLYLLLRSLLLHPLIPVQKLMVMIAALSPLERGSLSAPRSVTEGGVAATAATLHHHIFAFHGVDHHSGLGLLLAPPDQIIGLLLHHGSLQLVDLRLDGYLNLTVTMIYFLRMLKFL